MDECVLGGNKLLPYSYADVRGTKGKFGIIIVMLRELFSLLGLMTKGRMR